MVRTSVAAAIALVSLASVPAHADGRFEGILHYIAAQNCTVDGEASNVGNRFTSRFTPAGFDGNGPFTGLGAISDFFGAHYVLNGATFTRTFQTVNGVAYGNSSGPFQARIRITEQKPATLDASTEFVTLKGQIEGSRGDPGVGGQKCVVTFRAAYVRRFVPAP